MIDTLPLPEVAHSDVQSPGLVVMTPVGPGGQPFLGETISSVVESFHQNNMPLTWILCGGYGVEPMDAVFAEHGIEVQHIPIGDAATWDEVTIIDNTFGCPAGVGRNTIATSAPDGAWLVNLDADDIMLPDRLRMVSECEPDVAYHFCSASDILPDGSTVEFPTEPGFLDMGWRQEREDIHYTTMSIRRENLIAAGGYPGIVCCEDGALCNKLSTLPITGKVDSRVGVLYRKGHGDNMTMNEYNSEVLYKLWGTF